MLGRHQSFHWQGKAPLGALLLLMAVPALAQDPAQTAEVPPQRVVVISVPDRKLVVVEDEQVLATFRVAVGATESPSPTGEFRVINRLTNPTYYHPGSVIPAGKRNPLGTRWIGLSRKGYGIHGTNVPNSVGRAASHGCIRLRNRDIERLFSIVRVGDRVEIHGERDEQVARLFGSSTQNEVASATALSQEAGGQ